MSSCGAGLRAIAIFGGGTGGHLFPGISLAERARERFPGCRAVFFRTSRSVEDRVFHGRGLETVSLSLRPPSGGFASWIRYARDAVKVERTIRKDLARGVDAAFGLGGYASLPGILAARRLGIPVILLEQNVKAGRVNRLLAPFVDAVACSFEETELPLASRRVVTGNPLRREVLEEARMSRPRVRSGRTVLVVGGSQGASGVNRAVRDALPELLDLREKIYWIHVAGDADKDGMSEAYRKTGFQAEVHAFTPDLPALMAQSDLVLGRAGGTTLSELAALGVPSVLVPYPHHKDEHQKRNAEVFVRSGGALLLEEAEITAESLRCVLQDVLLSPDRLASMARGARRLARTQAADAILDLAMELKSPCPPVSASSS